MNIRKERFFYFSGEGPIKGLPVECEFVRKIDNDENRDVALVKCKHFIEGYGLQNLVIIPKSVTGKLFSEENGDNVVFLYVLNGDKYGEVDWIDLSAAGRDMVDWGGVTNDYKELKKWYCWD